MIRPFTIYSSQPYRKILFFLVYIIGWNNVQGQSFPVEAALTITPPHSLVIEELGSAFNSNLQGSLLLKDLNTSSIDVVLRLTIESNSLKIQTNPMYTGTIITLDPGLPHTLNNQELSDLFRPENLTFSGLSKANYQKTGRLPEGQYKICLRTYEVSRNIPVSNIACNYVRLVLHDPPFINLPENNTKIESRLPQNIFFQWSPRHQDPSFQTEYEFTLAEIFPQDRNAYDAFATSPIVFQTITPLTSLTYTNDYPLLEPGKRYAFRIRVLNSMNSLFKNDGYSEVFTFLYGDACKMPETMHIEDIREDYIQWSMEESGDYNSYQISYISKENLSKQPYNKDFYTSRMHLTALKPSTTYAIEIRGNCRGYYSPPLLAEIKTTAPYFNPFTCSDRTPPLPDPGGSPEFLLKGDTLFSSDFRVIVEEAQASNGSFSGTGYIQMPFFQRAIVGVQFEDITLNSHYRHLSGFIHITGAGIDMPEIIHYLDSLDNLLDRGEEILGEIQTIADTLAVYLPKKEAETIIAEETDTLTSITQTIAETPEEEIITNNEETIPTNEGQNNLNQTETQSTGAPTVTVIGTSGTSSTVVETRPEPATRMKFGPLDIQLKDIPQPGDTDESGYCAYTDLSGSTLLKLPFDFVDKEIHLENARISFKQNCEDYSFKNFTLIWENLSTNLHIGWLPVVVKKAEIEIDSEGMIKGTLTFMTDIAQDILLQNIARIESTGQSTFEYHFSHDTNLSGKFNFSTLGNLTLKWLTNNTELAEWANLTFDENGTLHVHADRDTPVTFTTEELKTEIQRYNIDAELSLNEGFRLQNGSAAVKFSGMKDIKGEINAEINIQEDQFHSSINASSLEAFGMEINELELDATIRPTFELVQLFGSFKANHPSFGSSLNVVEFRFADQKIETFIASGSIVYEGLKIEVETSRYLPEQQLLTLDASVQIEKEGNQFTAALSDFSIASDGTITLGDYSISAQLKEQFGPLTVEFSTEPKRSKRVSGFDVYQNIEASLYMEMKGKRGTVEKKIGKATVSYEKNNREEWKNVQAKWQGTKIPVGSLLGLDLFLTQLDIQIPGSKNKAITGKAIMDVFLSSDLKLSSIHAGFIEKTGFDAVIKKGLSAQAEFTYSGSSSDFSGMWKIKAFKNLSLELHKQGKPIALLKNISIADDGKVMGTLEAYGTDGWEINGLTAKLNSLNLTMSVYPFEEDPKFTLHKGKGEIEIVGLSNLEGKLALYCEFDEENIYTKVSEATHLRLAGMQLEKFQLDGEFTRAFELVKVQGTMEARHPEFESTIKIVEFIYKQEGLTSLIMENTRVKYKGFDFQLDNLIYHEEKIAIDARVEIDLGNNDGARLAVDEFIILPDGRLKVGKIEGRLDKSPVMLSFSAAFSESRFKGSFEGDFGKYFSMTGVMDLGSKEDYLFGYYSINASTNIPLGSVFKISRLGGNLGYNYSLTYNPTSKKFVGNPKKGTYVIGLGLGIADQADMMEIYGNPIVQFGKDQFELLMEGSLKIPRNEPNFTGTLRARYTLPDNTAEGSLVSDIMVPSNSGKLLKGKNMALNFSYNEKGWSVQSSNLRASILNTLTFSGNADMKSSNNFITGKLMGSIDYSYDYQFNKSYWFGTFDGAFDFDFSSSTMLELTDKTIKSELKTSVSRSTSFSFTCTLNTAMASASFDGETTVKLEGTSRSIRGTLHFEYESTLKSGKFDTDINIAL